MLAKELPPISSPVAQGLLLRWSLRFISPLWPDRQEVMQVGNPQCVFGAYCWSYNYLLHSMQGGPELLCLSSLDAAHQAALNHPAPVRQGLSGIQ